MDFELSEDMKMIQSLARDFVTEQLKPLERDLMGRAADLSDARMFLDEAAEVKLIKMAQDTGLWGASIPEILGGVGLDTLGNCLVEEELAQTVIPFNFGDVTPLLFDCNDQQKANYLLPVLNRHKQAYLALIEPEKGADISTMKVRAEKVNGDYLLNGEKVSFSRSGKDYFAVVFAATAGNGSRDGVTCFLVDKDTVGFKVIDSAATEGWQSQVRKPMLLTFEKCRVPAENILGEAGKAFSLGKKWLPSRRIIRGARCVGVAQRLLEEATTRAQTWQTFGESIAGRPGIQAALTNIALSIHACRLLVYEAAWKADKGESVRREAAMVKLFATQMLHTVADDVVHIYGGPAYVAGLPMERLCRNALAASATELALELQRSVIARDILKGLKI
ncbi:MAG: acyl-CoA dehydrogenase family protein [Dehalococcoidales bacterium]|nr:acyl-CoA dehydrogenase family protein [Dehalococcoidales bacterium]